MTKLPQSHIDEIIEKYGKGSNQYRIRVLGEEPTPPKLHALGEKDPFGWLPISEWWRWGGDLILGYNPIWKPRAPRILQNMIHSSGRQGWGYPNKGYLLRQQPTHFILLPELPE